MFNEVRLHFDVEEMKSFLGKRGYTFENKEITTYTGPYGKVEDTHTEIYAQHNGTKSDVSEPISSVFYKEFKKHLLSC